MIASAVKVQIHDTDWEKFNRFLEDELGSDVSLLSTSDIDVEISKISDVLNRAISLFLRRPPPATKSKYAGISPEVLDL